nr:reverse transcriptase domain-containing protein [Tanacetum cinerariifolium]
MNGTVHTLEKELRYIRMAAVRHDRSTAIDCRASTQHPRRIFTRQTVEMGAGPGARQSDPSSDTETGRGRDYAGNILPRLVIQPGHGEEARWVLKSGKDFFCRFGDESVQASQFPVEALDFFDCSWGWELCRADINKPRRNGFHLRAKVLVEVLKEKSIQKEEVATIVEKEGPTWMTLIIEYLKDGTIPDDRKATSKLCIKLDNTSGWKGFFTDGETVAASKKRVHTPWKSQDQSKRQNSERRPDFKNQPKDGRGSNKFTPLTRTPKEILAAKAGKFKPPPPMVTSVEKRSSRKFCERDKDQQKTGKKDAPAKDKAASIYMIQSWQRVTRQRVKKSFTHVKEITFPPLAANKGT